MLTSAVESVFCIYMVRTEIALLEAVREARTVYISLETVRVITISPFRVSYEQRSTEHALLD